MSTSENNTWMDDKGEIYLDPERPKPKKEIVSSNETIDNIFVYDVEDPNRINEKKDIYYWLESWGVFPEQLKVCRMKTKPKRCTITYRPTPSQGGKYCSGMDRLR